MSIILIFCKTTTAQNYSVSIRRERELHTICYISCHHFRGLNIKTEIRTSNLDASNLVFDGQSRDFSVISQDSIS